MRACFQAICEGLWDQNTSNSIQFLSPFFSNIIAINKLQDSLWMRQLEWVSDTLSLSLPVFLYGQSHRDSGYWGKQLGCDVCIYIYIYSLIKFGRDLVGLGAQAAVWCARGTLFSFFGARAANATKRHPTRPLGETTGHWRRFWCAAACIIKQD